MKIVILNKFSGRWSGEIRGPYNARISLTIDQDDDSNVSGHATIVETKLGICHYVVFGSASDRLEIQLAPDGQDLLRLGVLRISAALKDSELTGTWTSLIGPSGTLIANNDNARRETVDGTNESKPANRIEAGRIGRQLRPNVVVDAYRLKQRLGRGFSGEVWRAELIRPIQGIDLMPGQEVAIKFYFPSMLQGMESIRIQREFMIAADAYHENLARVYDLILSPSRPFHTFMVMEFVAGKTLKSFIGQQGPLEKASVVEMGMQLFGALKELHSLGAIHRDVKAANIMVASSADTNHKVKLVDLGIVAMKHEDKFTAASAFMGSKHSSPLEQLLGKEVDERADIYGAGSVLFNCLFGNPMYSGVGPEGAIVQRMMTEPETLASHGRLGQLESFIDRCIAVDARDRPSNAEQCLEEIREIF